MPKNIYLGLIKLTKLMIGTSKKLTISTGESIIYTSTTPISLANVTYDNATYDGTQKVATNIVVTLNGVTLTKDVDYTVINNGGINAGSYTLTIEGMGDYDNYISQTFIISKADPTITAAPTNANPTYDGTEQYVLTGGTANIPGAFTYSTGTNAGSYTGSWTFTPIDTANYNTASGTVAASIAKANPIITAAPTNANPTYDGTEQYVLTGGTANIPGAFTYSTGTNAGSYTGSWTFTPTDTTNYNTVSGTVAASIAKVNPIITAAPTNVNPTYDGTEQYVLTGGTANIPGTFTYSTGTNAGSYTGSWTFTPTDTTNYNTVSGTVAASIAKANPTITVAPTNANPTYNGSSQYVLTGGTSNIAGSFSYSTGTNAGSYTGSWTFTPTDTTNYNTASGTVAATISKVTPTVTSPVPNVLTYNKSAQELATIGSVNFGIIKYSLDNSIWSTSMPTAINGGSYTLYYKIDGDSNINNVAADSILCSIAEKRVTNPTITLSQNSYTYNGSSFTPTPTVKDGTDVIDPIEYTVSYLNNTNAGTGTVVISDIVDGNYYIEGTQTFIIAKANISPSVSMTGWTYGGTATNPSVSDNSGSGSVTYNYKVNGANDSTYTTTKPSNAGSYMVRAQIAETTNYNGATVTNTFTIYKATPSLSVSMSGWTYGRSPSNPSVSGNSGGGSVTYYYKVYGTADSTYTTTKPSNAGTYIIRADVAETTNYKPTSATRTFTIDKADLSASVHMSGWTYGRSPSNPSVSNNPGGGSVTYYYKVYGTADSTYTTTKPSNAGTYTIMAQIAETTNYNGVTVTNTFIIDKADLSASVHMSGWTYGGTATNPSVSGNSGSGSVTYYYKVYGTADSTYTTTKPSNAGTYTIMAQIAETTNYKPTTVTNTFTIAKATLPISVSVQDYTYGEVGNVFINGNTYGGSTTVTYKLYGSDDSTYTAYAPNTPGTYVVRLQVTETANYNATTVTNTFTISKANISPSLYVWNWVYGNLHAYPTVSGNDGNASVTYYYKTYGDADSTYVTTEPSHIGTYTVKAVIPETTNYYGATLTKNFSITSNFKPSDSDVFKTSDGYYFVTND